LPSDELARDDLQRACDRDAEERAHDPPSSGPAATLSAIASGEVDGAVVDELLQDAVLELLVEHEYHDGDAGSRRTDPAPRVRRTEPEPFDRCADERDEVEDRNEQRSPPTACFAHRFGALADSVIAPLGESRLVTLRPGGHQR
jgi:hypothetical protein